MGTSTVWGEGEEGGRAMHKREYKAIFPSFLPSSYEKVRSPKFVAAINNERERRECTMSERWKRG